MHHEYICFTFQVAHNNCLWLITVENTEANRARVRRIYEQYGTDSLGTAAGYRWPGSTARHIDLSSFATF